MPGHPSSFRLHPLAQRARRTWRALCCALGLHAYGYDWLDDPQAGRRRRCILCADCGKALLKNFDPRT